MMRAVKRQGKDIDQAPASIDPEFDQEIAFQEQAADSTIDDIAAMQYEVVEGEDTTLMDGLEDEDMKEEEEVPKERRVAILLELLQAQPHELESKISQFSDEIDSDLLELLRQRLETARRLNSDGSVDAAPSFTVQRLEDLYRSLKVVLQRNEASPAMRLLDDVLEILGGGQEDSSNKIEEEDEMGLFQQRERKNEAARRMKSAFCGGLIESSEGGIDIFSAARALAEGGPLAAAQMSVEYVRQEDFILEATELLAGARDQQKNLEREIDRAKRELAYAQKRQVDTGAKASSSMTVAEEQIKLAEMAYVDREEGIEQLEEVIAMARQLSFEDSVALRDIEDE